jgi:hypothetical protein
MTVYTDNGEKVTRNYRILITEANRERGKNAIQADFFFLWACLPIPHGETR